METVRHLRASTAGDRAGALPPSCARYIARQSRTRLVARPRTSGATSLPFQQGWLSSAAMRVALRQATLTLSPLSCRSTVMAAAVRLALSPSCHERRRASSSSRTPRCSSASRCFSSGVWAGAAGCAEGAGFGGAALMACSSAFWSWPAPCERPRSVTSFTEDSRKVRSSSAPEPLSAPTCASRLQLLSSCARCSGGTGMPFSSPPEDAIGLDLGGHAGCPRQRALRHPA
mmetsp:Transcript_52868/g.169331  ORF Transcript_52868/g.169331 Transcript_52868/m.169331 type:complete len:230 (+) Transcript_52868:267-956(+)